MDYTQSSFGGRSLAGESIFWLARPLPTNVPSPEDSDFDAPVQNGGGMRLEVRFIYWFPLRIPFADWVMTRMFMAHFALQDYNAVNPLIPAETWAGWTSGRSPPNLDAQIRSKYQQHGERQAVRVPHPGHLRHADDDARPSPVLPDSRTATRAAEACEWMR